MRVILKEEVEGLGFAGDVVEVKPGYGRNYLLPRGLAVKATSGELQGVAQQRSFEERREAVRKSQFEELADALSGKTIVIYKRAGSGSKLYGSVTTQDIAAAMEEQLGLEVERRRLSTGQPIKVLGEHDVTVSLAKEVEARFTIEVRREGAEEEAEAAAAEEAQAEPEPEEAEGEPAPDAPAEADLAEEELPQPATQ